MKVKKHNRVPQDIFWWQITRWPSHMHLLVYAAGILGRYDLLPLHPLFGSFCTSICVRVCLSVAVSEWGSEEEVIKSETRHGKGHGTWWGSRWWWGPPSVPAGERRIPRGISCPLTLEGSIVPVSLYTILAFLPRPQIVCSLSIRAESQERKKKILPHVLRKKCYFKTAIVCPPYSLISIVDSATLGGTRSWPSVFISFVLLVQYFHCYGLRIARTNKIPI